MYEQNSFIFDTLVNRLKEHGAIIYTEYVESVHGKGLRMKEPSPWLHQDALHQVALYIPGKSVLNVKNLVEQVPELALLLNNMSYPDAWEWDERRLLSVFLLLIQKIDTLLSPFAQFWKEYLKLLPRTFSLPTRYHEQELSLIHHTNLLRALQARKRRLGKEYEMLKIWWSWEKLPSMDEWIYVNELIWSRTIGIPDTIDIDTETITLVPLMDFANHSFETNGKWVLQDPTESQEGGIFLMVNKDIGTEEIRVNYGFKSNEELLFQYGFAIPDNDIGVWPLLMFFNRANEQEHYSKAVKIAAIVLQQKGRELSMEEGKRYLCSKVLRTANALPNSSLSHPSVIENYLMWYLEGQHYIYKKIIEYLTEDQP
jgi:hypothetical protein